MRHPGSKSASNSQGSPPPRERGAPTRRTGAPGLPGTVRRRTLLRRGTVIATATLAGLAGAAACAPVKPSAGSTALSNWASTGTGPTTTTGGVAGPAQTPSAPATIRRTRGPNVLLITIDSIRADRLGAYGFSAAHTPTLDRLASQGARFEHAICQLPQTDPSHAALLTGLYASTNGVKVHMVDKLSPNVQTMADVFKAGGYTTGAIYSWVSLDPPFCGLNQGFDTYQGYVLNRTGAFSNRGLEQVAAFYRTVKDHVPIVNTADVALGASQDYENTLDGRADVTTAAALQWIDAHASRGPFFLWVHYYDPHYPYSPPAGYDHLFNLRYTGHIDGSVQTMHQITGGTLVPTSADLARLRELYQGEISFADAQIHRVFSDLENRGLLDDTIIALTGDHGESFGEHGDWEHGKLVYETEVRVPLLLRYPRQVAAGQIVSTPVQLIDVMPTLLQLTGLTAPKPVQGTSFLPLLGPPMVPPPSPAAGRVTFTELADESFVAMLTADWKLIRNNANEQLQLYLLSDDEAETNNLVKDQPRIARELNARLQDLMYLSGVSRR
jgi:arylsulfatase A-like enzyme